ncbi:MAG: hypothetical protein JRD93_00050 [Deltaproteobacteria bacterium]|nr:hypothetical protein [Deltaproteobacteria bacterium]MBW2660399.1 hypothetical protein [Deltaproteobacteria bacterium]
MKQKYLILRNDENNELIIKEFVEQSKEMFLLIRDETYDSKIIESAMAIDKQHLIAALRNRDFYPPEIYADKIAESVMFVYGAEDNQPVELLIDDADLLAKSLEALKAAADIKKEVVELDVDELLEDEFDEDFDGTNIVKKNCSIKIADDEPNDAVVSEEK